MKFMNTLAAIIIGMVLLGCGSQQKAGVSGAGAPGAGGATNLVQALAELDALPTPPGVSDELFSALKDAFGKALAENASGGKFASEAPDGEANKVIDLHFRPDGDDYYLVWGYRNTGDYNQDGVANVADLTPLAIYFNANVIEVPEADPVDGDRNTSVNIADITPLAVNFGVACSKYAIEGGPSSSGPWELIEEAPLTEATDPPGRRQFDHLMSDIGYAYFRVVPRNDLGESGIPSDGIPGPGEVPVITGVSPTSVPAGSEQTFVATVSGSEPFTYAWDFGGGATPVPPSTLTDAEPVVTITDTIDTYFGSLTVTNQFGEDTYGFNLTVNAPAFSVSGTVTETVGGAAIPGVTLTLSPGGYNALTGDDGNYIITDVPDGDYTLTPSKTDYVFTPPSANVAVAGADVTGVDFTGEIPPTYTVSGTVYLDMAGLEGVILSLGGGLTDTTNSSGNYAIADVPPGSYTLTPSLFGYSFTPPSRSVNVVDSDITSQNFIAEEAAPSWSYTTIDSTQGKYNNVSLMVAAGNPAVAYSYEDDDGVVNSVMFARSSTADGTGSWTISPAIESDSGGDATGNYLGGAIVGGNPAIAYNREVGYAPDHIKYTQNSAADGSGTWSGPFEFDDKDAMQWVSLADVGGLPAISYQNTVGSQGVFFAGNSAADGSGSWVMNTIEGGGAGLGSWSSIANVGGKPGVSYYFTGGGQFNPKFAINSSANGSGSWSYAVPDMDSPSGANVRLAVIAGKPAVAYQKSNALWVAIASSPDGVGVWSTALVDGTNLAGGGISMAVVGGQPSIAYTVDWPYYLRFAINSSPDGSGTWVTSDIDTSPRVGQPVSLADVGGKPAVAYWDYTNKVLKYAVMQ